MDFNYKTKKSLKSFMAMVLAVICALGVLLQMILAAEAPVADPLPTIKAEPFIARIYGEDLLVGADGIAYEAFCADRVRRS